MVINDVKIFTRGNCKVFQKTYAITQNDCADCERWKWICENAIQINSHYEL